jgi:hypothetical protein
MRSIRTDPGRSEERGLLMGRNSTGTAAITPHSDRDPGQRKLHMLAADPSWPIFRQE